MKKKLGFKLGAVVDRPIAEVFNAVVDPVKLSSYFTKSSSGPLQEGKTVTWDFGNMADDVHVEEVIPNEKIVCSWPACNGVGHSVHFTFTFESIEKEKTRVGIEEEGWELTSQQELDSSYMQCGGWTNFLNLLRARLEYNIDLRCSA